MDSQPNHNEESLRRAERRRRRRARLAGAVATVMFHAVVLLGLIWAALDFVPFDNKEHRWPPVKDEELLYGGEYVVLGQPLASETNDKPQTVPESAPEQAQNPAPEGSDADNAGEPLDQSQTPVVQTQPSPVKVHKDDKPKPAGPTQAEIEEQQRIKRQKEASQRINDRVSFGSATPKTKQGKEGRPDGNSSTGSLSGAPGTDLKGRTLASWSKPSGTATGTITVRVTVDRKGKVHSAKYASGTGAIAGSSAARRSCEQAALRSAFSVSDDAPASQTGTITYRFE